MKEDENMSKRSLSDRQKGMICIILSAFCFAWMNAFVRLSGDLPFIQKSFFRNLVALLFALAMLLREHGCFLPKKGSLPFLVLRATAGTLGILCNFYAIDHLALSDASILNKMSPFFAILCSWIFLREKLNWKQGLIVLGAFVGALCVIKPTFANADLFPSLIGLLGGFGAGVAYTMVRRLGQIGENKAYIVFFFSAFSCVVTLPYLLFCYERAYDVEAAVVSGYGRAFGGRRTVRCHFCVLLCTGKGNFRLRLHPDHFCRRLGIFAVCTDSRLAEHSGVLYHHCYGSGHVFL